MRSNRTKLLFILISFISLALFLITCQKEKLATREFPRLGTLEVTDISDAGAIFHGEIISLGNDEIVDHGFVWSATDPLPRLGVSDKISLGPQGISGPYSAEITTTLEASENYTVRAYAVTSKDQAVYGQVIEFFSLGSEAPSISEIIPITGTWFDTIQIKGSNFSNLAHSNTVLFDTVEAIVVSATDSLLEVRVPLNLLKINSKISISIAGNKTLFSENFSLLPPQITEIIPESGFYKDTLTILGEDFYPTLYQNEFKIDGVSCKVISSNSKTLNVLVPPELTEGLKSVSLDIVGQVFTKENSFYSSAPQIQTFFPASGTYLDTITITGINFHSERLNKILTIGDIVVTPDFYNDSIIKLGVPTDLGKKFSDIVLVVESLNFYSEQQYELLSPEIYDIAPGTALFGDTVTISGNYFNPDNTRNLLEIGEAIANVISSTQNIITAQVPYDLFTENGLADAKLSIGELIGNQDITINIPAPVITHFSPDSGIVGEILTIYGNNFNPLKDYTTLHLGDLTPIILSSTYDSIKINLPFETDPAGSPTTINVNGQESMPSVQFNLKPLVITSIEPNLGYRGSWVIIKGKNFSFNPDLSYNSNNIIQFRGTQIHGWYKKSISNSELRFQIPNTFPIQDGQTSIGIQVGLQSISFADSFLFIEPWKEIESFPVFNWAYNLAAFSIGELGYVGLGSYRTKQLYEYNPSSNQWTLLSDYPGFSEGMKDGFSVNDTGYIYSGSEFYAYHPEMNTWEKKINNPSFANMATSFVINDKAYVGVGSSPIFWEYDPSINEWTRMADFPAANPGNSVGFAVSNKGYVYDYRSGLFCEYDPVTNEWTEKAPFPGQNRYFAVGFSIEEYGYIGTGSTGSSYKLNDIYEYNPLLDKWTRKADVPLYLDQSFGFSIGGKGYLGGGSTNYSSGRVFEFDPTK